jgi:hypothetical protein
MMNTVGTPDTDDVSLRGSNLGTPSPDSTILFEQQQQQENKSNNEHNHRQDQGDHGCLSFNIPSAAKVPTTLALSMSTTSIGSSWSNELACLRQTGDVGYSHLFSFTLLLLMTQFHLLNISSNGSLYGTSI